MAGTAEALRAEIRKEVEDGPGPREADHAVFDRYGIESVTQRIDDLYEQILAGRPRRVQRLVARRRPATRPARGLARGA